MNSDIFLTSCSHTKFQTGVVQQTSKSHCFGDFDTAHSIDGTEGSGVRPLPAMTWRVP